MVLWLRFIKEYSYKPILCARGIVTQTLEHSD